MSNDTAPPGWRRLLGWLSPKWRKARDVEQVTAWENEGGASASPSHAGGNVVPARADDAKN